MVYPRCRRLFLIPSHASASFIPCTVTRAISQPASAKRMIWSIVASTSRVFEVVIDWMRIGLLPPTPILPTRTSRVFHRFVLKIESQYLIIIDVPKTSLYMDSKSSTLLKSIQKYSLFWRLLKRNSLQIIRENLLIFPE